MGAKESEKILVVDDSPEIIRLLREVLIREGYRVVTTSAPEEASHLVEKERPNLVILDICMPHLDGWGVCQRIRQVSSVPILMLTVLSESRHIERGLQLGADAYMVKPFTIDALLAQVRSLLGQGPRIRRIM